MRFRLLKRQRFNCGRSGTGSAAGASHRSRGRRGIFTVKTLPVSGGRFLRRRRAFFTALMGGDETRNAEQLLMAEQFRLHGRARSDAQKPREQFAADLVQGALSAEDPAGVKIEIGEPQPYRDCR